MQEILNEKYKLQQTEEISVQDLKQEIKQMKNDIKELRQHSNLQNLNIEVLRQQICQLEQQQASTSNGRQMDIILVNIATYSLYTPYT